MVNMFLDSASNPPKTGTRLCVVSARGVEILDSSLASDNQPFDSAHRAPRFKEATNDITRRIIKRKEIYPRTKVFAERPYVVLRKICKGSVDCVLLYYGRSVLGSVL